MSNLVRKYEELLDIDVTLLLEMISNKASLNALRHEATDYDEMWKALTKEARRYGRGDYAINMMVSTLKNKVNERLVEFIYNSKNNEILELNQSLAIANAELVVKEAVNLIAEVKVFCDTRNDQFILNDGTYKW